MGKIFHPVLNFSQRCVLLVSYFGYNCGMMGVIFLLIRFYNLTDNCSFLSQLLSFH